MDKQLKQAYTEKIVSVLGTPETKSFPTLAAALEACGIPVNGATKILIGKVTRRTGILKRFIVHHKKTKQYAEYIFCTGELKMPDRYDQYLKKFKITKDENDNIYLGGKPLDKTALYYDCYKDPIMGSRFNRMKLLVYIKAKAVKRVL